MIYVHHNTLYVGTPSISDIAQSNSKSLVNQKKLHEFASTQITRYTVSLTTTKKSVQTKMQYYTEIRSTLHGHTVVYWPFLY